MKKLFLIFIISFRLSASYEVDLPNTKVLFVGNSYLYYNDSLHNHVKRMAFERFPDIQDKFIYKSSTIGGASSWHHNFEHLLNSKNIGVKESFDLLILQGGSSEPLSKKSRARFKDTVKQVKEIAEKHGTKLALYMTHAYVPPDKRYKANMIDDISSLYIDAGKINDLVIIPVGIGFKNAYEADPKIKLHNIDGTHPSLLGTYLAACIVYGVLYGDSPLGLEYNYNNKISEKEKLFIQTIAQNTVQDFLN